MHEPKKLLAYLETQKDNAYPYYDSEYALRICLKHGNEEATIFLYKTMKLYEEAVDQALRIENKEVSGNFSCSNSDLKVSKALLLDELCCNVVKCSSRKLKMRCIIRTWRNSV